MNPEDPRTFTYHDTPFTGFVRVDRWESDLPSLSEVVTCTDSVTGLIIDLDAGRVLLTEQQRVAMIREDNPHGFIRELIGGRFDVSLSPQELLAKEVSEEVGIEISPGDVQLINMGAPMALSAGVLTERSYGALIVLRGATIPPDAPCYGLASEGERIRRHWMSIDEFVDPSTVHDSWRVWAIAQYVARRILEGTL